MGMPGPAKKSGKATTKILLGVLAVVVVGVGVYFLSNGGLFKGSIFGPGPKIVLNVPATVSEQGANTATVSIKTAAGMSVTENVTATVSFTETVGGAPFAVSGDTNLVIPTGSAESNFVTLTVSDDTVATNPDAKIAATLSNVVGADVVLGNTNKTITILDPEDTPAASVTLSVDNPNILEDSTPSSAKITATLSQAFYDQGCTVTVPLTFSGDDAADYTLQSTNNPSDPATIKFIPGPATTNFVTLTAKNDTTAEGLKAIKAGMGTPVKTCAGGQTNLTVGTPDSVTVKVTDDEDSSPKVSNFTVSPSVINRPGQGSVNRATFTATLNHKLDAHDVTIPVTFTGGAVVDGDYTVDSVNRTITIAKGSTTGYLVVTAKADYDPNEQDKTIIGTIGSGVTPSYVASAAMSQTTTLKGDTPKVTVTMPTGDVNENSTAARVYKLSVAPTFNQEIIAIFSLDGKAKANVDYKLTSDLAGRQTIRVEANNQFSVKIPVNSNGTQFYLFALNDSTYEGAETVAVKPVTLSPGATWAPGSDTATDKFSIKDEEDMPTVSVKLNNTNNSGTSIYEPWLNTSPTSVTLNLALSGASTVSGSVTLQFAGGATTANLFNLTLNGQPKTLTNGKLTLDFNPANPLPILTLAAKDEANHNPALRTLDATVKVDASTVGAKADTATKNIMIIRKF